MWDYITNISIVILWNTSPTFRALCVTILFLAIYKYVFKPQFDACDFNDRWNWWGAKSDLKDKPLFVTSGIITFIVSVWAIKLLFIAVFL